MVSEVEDGLVGLRPLSVEPMLSPGRECQNWVEFLDTLLVSENGLLAWGSSPHPNTPHHTHIHTWELGPGTQKNILHLETETTVSPQTHLSSCKTFLG